MAEPKIIFEDDEILILDKPFGLTVNKSETTKGEETVQEWIEKKCKVQSSKFKVGEEDGDFYSRAGIVHRIDKETSGILIAAKTKEAFENLQSQFKERKVKKTYIALVHGKVVPQEGEISVPVGRLPWARTKFGVLPGGKEALTKYKVIGIWENGKWEVSRGWEEWVGKVTSHPIHTSRHTSQISSPLTLLEAYPETGRTHQIRVHMKYFNHPIFADFLYAGRKTQKHDRKVLPRVFLHAAKISFYHPKTGEQVFFESPLPEELKTFIESLQENK